MDPSRNLVVLILVQGLALLTLSCGGSSSAVQSAPRVLKAGAVTATGNPLVAQYTISPSSPANVTVEFGPNTSYGFETSAQPTSAGGGAVTILVAGMKPFKIYHMRAIVKYLDGTQQTDSDQVFVTGALPAGRVAPLAVTTPSGLPPAPGVDLVSLIPGSANQLEALALDPAGDVVWYYDYDRNLGLPHGIKLLSNGHMLTVLYPGGGPGGTVREIDLAGNIVHQFTANDLNQSLANAGINLTVYAIHHDFWPLANGHLLLLVNTDRSFTDLPGYPGQTNVLGDAIVDLDPNDQPVWAWNSFDHLDVNRHPMLFPDWTHANSLFYCPDDGNLLISLRHQHWVLKIDYEDGRGTGDVMWRLGYQGDFTLASGAPANWFYAQHFANIVSPNTTGDFQLALFDNGDFRVLDSSGTTCGSPGAAGCYSRPAIFEVNETSRAASLVWAYNTVYSFWGGVAQLLPNSNVFFNMSSPADNPSGTRAMEVTQLQTPQVVWQLDVNGQNSYRTIHLPSLYPGIQW